MVRRRLVIRKRPERLETGLLEVIDGSFGKARLAPVVGEEGVEG